MTAGISKGRRLIKFLVVAVLLVLLFGGAARMIVAGGAKSLNLGDRLLGDSDGATLQVAGQPYGAGGRNKLNIWVPTGTRKTDKLPVLVWLYGGGWYSGQRDDYGFAGRAFAKQGFIVVIPDYRLVPEGHWPDFLQKVARNARHCPRCLLDEVYRGGRRLREARERPQSAAKRQARQPSADIACRRLIRCSGSGFDHASAS